MTSKPFATTGLDRRAALRSAASVTALAAAAGVLGRPLLSSAAAQSQPRPQSPARPQLPVADPYAALIVSGPSNRGVGAVGTTPPVPGDPEIIPTAPGWSAIALFTVGNEVGGYRLSGVPDGLGAFDNRDGTITVLVNHEIEAGHGAKRDHGGVGAFVSRWIVDKSTLAVLAGRDFVDRPANLHLVKPSTRKSLVASVMGRLRKRAGKSANSLGIKPPPPAAPATPQPTAAAAPGAPAPTAAAAPPAPPPPPPDPRNLTRLCSADLAPVSAFYNHATRTGYDGYIFLNGEEADKNANRAFAWIVADASAYELPVFAFGKAGDETIPPPQWENFLAHPGTGDTTLVMANSDGGPNEIYVYIGKKQNKGTPVDRAGLTNGHLYSLRVTGIDSENRETDVGLTKSLVDKGAGRPIALAAPYGGTDFLRPEDGAWDPTRPNVYYFVSTDRNNFAAGGSFRPEEDPTQVGRSRLWAVTFDTVTKLKTNGDRTGRIQLLLDGTEGGDMFDNITVDRAGIVYLCEDTGKSRHNGKIWAYDTHTGELHTIMRFNPALFGDVVGTDYKPPVAPFVDDKETSGILDVTDLFADAPWFRPGSTVLLVDVQAHFDYDSEDPIGEVLYEGGQLLLLVKAPK